MAPIYLGANRTSSGLAGPGVPIGGTTGQVLRKVNSTDYNTEWFSPVVASGTAAMGTSAIASGASATTVTVTATGVSSADIPEWGFNANPNTVTGYNAASTTGCLVITAWCTTDAVNFLVSNPTAASITPGALTLNWKVTR